MGWKWLQKGRGQQSHAEVLRSLLPQILILLQVQIQAPSCTQPCASAGRNSVSHDFHHFWRRPSAPEPKCASHYQKEDSQSQVTEGELPSMVSCGCCICCIWRHSGLQEARVHLGEGMVLSLWMQNIQPYSISWLSVLSSPPAISTLKAFSVGAFYSLDGWSFGNFQNFWTRIPVTHTELVWGWLAQAAAPPDATRITTLAYETGLLKSWSQVAKSVAVNSLSPEWARLLGAAARGSLRWPYLGLEEWLEGGEKPGGQEEKANTWVCGAKSPILLSWFWPCPLSTVSASIFFPESQTWLSTDSLRLGPSLILFQAMLLDFHPRLVGW